MAPCEPGFRIGRQVLVDPVAVFAAVRRVDHAGDVAGRRQHEALRPAEQLRAAIGRLPRRDVVLPRRQEIGRRLDLAEVDRHAGQRDAVRLRQQVLLVHLAQVEAVHPRRHAGRIGVPVQQVERERIVAQQVVVDDERPDQVVGAQHVERRRHLAAFEIAALVHLVFERLQLLLVDEHAQLAGLAGSPSW